MNEVTIYFHLPLLEYGNIMMKQNQPSCGIFIYNRKVDIFHYGIQLIITFLPFILYKDVILWHVTHSFLLIILAC
jgi:hypothetical protein